MENVSSKPDYVYKGLKGIYLAVHLKEQALNIRGSVNKNIGADFSKTVPFAEIRGVRNFSQALGWALRVQGIEIELNDLEVPVVRIPMNPKEQSVWIARIGQICNMKRLS